MPKFDMLNDFLATDINENIDFCDEVLKTIADTKMDSFSGNIYGLEISKDKAILTNLYDDNVTAESLELKQFQQQLMAWRKKITP